MTALLSLPLLRENEQILWFFSLMYFASYVVRINFAVMMVRICGDMNATKSDLAIVVTVLTMAYGVGQLISGFIGDKIKPRYLLTCGVARGIVYKVAIFFAYTMFCSTSIATRRCVCRGARR